MRVTARRIRRAPLHEAFFFAKAGRLGGRVREDLEQYKHLLKHIFTNREPYRNVYYFTPTISVPLRAPQAESKRPNAKK